MNGDRERALQASDEPTVVLTTTRLIIRRARPDDVDVAFLLSLWANPGVMESVGFPHGLRITPEEIRERLGNERDSPLGAVLLVQLKGTRTIIGQCKMGGPDDGGVAETDVKLLPQFWGQGFGTEIKRAMVDFLFVTTQCQLVQATPNRTNLASQRMQEAVGGRRVGEGIHRFPPHMRSFTKDVPFYVYQVTRSAWETKRRP